MVELEGSNDSGINLSVQRVVVTGATGFLGGHVLKQLRTTGAAVIAVLDRNRSSRHDSSTQSIETLYFDQPNQLVATVRSARPDYVIHLHAVVTTERSTAAVRRTLEVNLLPSLDLMVACGEMKVKRLSSWAPAKSLVP